MDLNKAMIEFKKFLDKYNNQDEIGFELKVKHTYQVVGNAKLIGEMLDLSDEDKKLAQLIALLHDIGRFEELTFFKKFDNAKFDHAAWGVKMLFEDNLIRTFIDSDKYDEIIKFAIGNHSRLRIDDTLDERMLLHAKIIRDADKLDNFRVKNEEVVESIFPGVVKSREEFENSLISDKVYKTVLECRCVDIHDRVTPLDNWLCVLAFTFDLNFNESYKIVKDNNYINRMIDRFSYNNEDSRIKMEKVRNLLNDYIDSKIPQKEIHTSK